MGTTAAVITALSGLAGAGTSIYGAATAPGPMKLPTPQPTDPTQLPKALLPTEKANAAANVGGGLSPDFLAGLIGESSGSPQGAMDILSSIRKSLNA